MRPATTCGGGVGVLNASRCVGERLRSRVWEGRQRLFSRLNRAARRIRRPVRDPARLPGALVLLAGVLLLAGCAKEIGAATPAPPATNPTPAASPAVGKGEWAAAAASSYDTLALKQDGTLWAWGLNDYGQLGQGNEDFIAHADPRQVGHAHDWVAVSGGYADSFALKKDGTLWAWGNNSDFGGNLGVGRSHVEPPGPGFVTSMDRWAPTHVGRARDWVAVCAGYEHGLAIRKSGSLWGWGPNWYGALGVGNTDWGWSVLQVGRDTDWAAVAGGGDFSLALKESGTLWAFGSNTYGNLGLGDTADRHTPTQVGSARDWAAVSAGVGYGMALKKDGTLWAWGNNDFGELGLGDTLERRVPTQAGSANDWVAAYCLGHHSVALRADGTLWAWGENSYGQLGLGDTADRSSPTQVGSATDWAAIAPGGADSFHTLALKQDGTLWAWGLNRFGQLGLGDTVDRLTPTQVRTAR
jgi:alpha-tubulin suppressor-like RCC1 family protein